jgi:predicted O-methyltransferase YrrM
MVQGNWHGAWSMEHGGGSMEHGAWGKGPGDGIILELGTSLGISALAMALAAPDKKLVTVEGCPALAALAAENLNRYGTLNTAVLNMEFSAALDKLERESTGISFAFIDGNHKGTALEEYVSRIRKMADEIIIVADDINLSADMYKGWRSITSTCYAGTTMEMFRFGIIFCLNNITPGHYLIRY